MTQYHVVCHTCDYETLVDHLGKALYRVYQHPDHHDTEYAPMGPHD